MQKCILKWLVSVSESASASERIRTFQLPVSYVICSKIHLKADGLQPLLLVVYVQLEFYKVNGLFNEFSVIVMPSTKYRYTVIFFRYRIPFIVFQYRPALISTSVSVHIEVQYLVIMILLAAQAAELSHSNSAVDHHNKQRSNSAACQRIW